MRRESTFTRTTASQSAQEQDIAASVQAQTSGARKVWHLGDPADEVAIWYWRPSWPWGRGEETVSVALNLRYITQHPGFRGAVAAILRWPKPPRCSIRCCCRRGCCRWARAP